MPPTMHESTKHPQRGRRPVSIDRHPKINGSGIPDSLPFCQKYVAIRKKVFGSTPFSKGVAGLQGGALREASEKGQRPVPIDRHLKINDFGLPNSLPFRKKYVAIRKKSFRIDPFFKRGRRVAGRGALQREPGYRAGALRKVKKQGDDARFYLLRKSLKKAESRTADSSRSKPFSTAVL